MRKLYLQTALPVKKVVALVSFWFIVCAGTANAQFILYQRLFETGVPSLAPYCTQNTLDYNASVGGSNGHACTPALSNIQQYATAGLTNPTIPVSFDVEISWPGYSTAAFTDSLNNYIAIVNDFKAINAHSPVGFYAVPPQQVYANFSSVNANFAPMANAMKPLANAVDYYSPDAYFYGSTIDTTSWRKYMDTTLAVIKKYYPTKPVYPYVNPTFNNVQIDSTAWLFVLNYLYKHTSGAMLWSASTPNWNENAPWWIGTKRFMVEKGLVPPLVFNNISVVNTSPTAGTQIQWVTSSDTISQYFVVQRSSDSVNFTGISGNINKKGPNYHLNTYNYTDSYIPASQKVYYRLAITDIHSNVSYSSILAYKRKLFRSSGSGVSVDAGSATNWQLYNGTSWAASPFAPSGNMASTDSMTIQQADTLKNNIVNTYFGAGVTVINKGTMGTCNNTIANRGTFVFAGTSLQTIPGDYSLSYSYNSWGNLVINNAAGVTSTQSTANNLLHVNNLYLQAGTFRVSASGGYKAGLYLDGQVTRGSGNLTVDTAGNYGITIDDTTAQTIPSGTFLSNTVYSIKAANNKGITINGNLAIANTTEFVTTAATINTTGNLTVGPMIIDTLNAAIAPITIGGTATVSGRVTVKNFKTAPSAGQQIHLISSSASPSGAFTSAVTMPAGYAGAVANSGNNVILTVNANPDSLIDIADAFVKSGANNVNTNFGANSYLAAENGYYEDYLKFDVSSVKNPPSKAFLRLYSAGAPATQWQLYKVNNNTWTESGITWNNKPVADTLLTTLTAPSAAGYVMWDITRELQNLHGTGQLSLKILSAQANYTSFTSKEGTVAQRPCIIFNNAVPKPDSVSAVADAFVKSSTPTTNYGFNSYLAADSAFYETYIKFTPNVTPSKVTSARLRLYNSGAASTSLHLYLVNNNTWTESGLNWNNKPNADTLLATIPVPSAAGFFNYDVTKQIKELSSGSSISFKLVASSAVYASMESRQGTAGEGPALMFLSDTNSSTNNITHELAVAPLISQRDTLPKLSILYPNPASQYTYVTLSEKLDPDNPVTITLYSASGQALISKTMRSSPEMINVSGYHLGVYYVRVSSKSKVLAIHKLDIVNP